MAGFLLGDTKTAIHMVNLLKFKDKAEYKDGRQTDLTGQEAYQIYAKEVQEPVSYTHLTLPTILRV